MTDTRIADIKTAGTLILLASALLVMPGKWNGENWVTESGIVLDEPWKWQFMPDPIST